MATNLAPLISSPEDLLFPSGITIYSGDIGHKGSYFPIPFSTVEMPEPIDTKAALNYLREQSIENFKAAEDALIAGACHPELPSSFKNLHYGQDSHGEFAIPLIDHLPHIGHHCVAVALFNNVCGTLVGLPKAVVDEITLRGLLHDATKIAELVIKDNIPGSYCMHSLAANALYFQNAERLVVNLPRTIRRYIEEVDPAFGYASFTRLLDLDKSSKDSFKIRLKSHPEAPLARLIAYISDICSSETHLCGPHLRVAVREFHVRYPNLFLRGLAIDKGRAIDKGKTDDCLILHNISTDSNAERVLVATEMDTQIALTYAILATLHRHVVDPYNTDPYNDYSEQEELRNFAMLDLIWNKYRELGFISAGSQLLPYQHL